MQTTLDVYQFAQAHTSSESGPYEKNRETPGSGSDWSGDGDNSDVDDFFTLPEDLLAKRDAEIREQAEVYEGLLQEATGKAK